MSVGEGQASTKVKERHKVRRGQVRRDRVAENRGIIVAYGLETTIDIAADG